MNLMYPGDYVFRGIIREFFFELYKPEDKVMSGGAQKVPHTVQGDSSLLF